MKIKLKMKEFVSHGAARDVDGMDPSLTTSLIPSDYTWAECVIQGYLTIEIRISV